MYLVAIRSTLVALTWHSVMKKLKAFKSGMVLRATDLHALHDALLQVAKKADVAIKSVSPHWKSGAILTAASLNRFLKDVELVLLKLDHTSIKWSFNKFEDGQVLKAEHLNEIVDKINRHT